MVDSRMQRNPVLTIHSCPRREPSACEWSGTRCPCRVAFAMGAKGPPSRPAVAGRREFLAAAAKAGINFRLGASQAIEIDPPPGRVPLRVQKYCERTGAGGASEIQLYRARAGSRTCTYEDA